jgi:hypothetical protein
MKKEVYGSVVLSGMLCLGHESLHLSTCLAQYRQCIAGSFKAVNANRTSYRNNAMDKCMLQVQLHHFIVIVLAPLDIVLR